MEENEEKCATDGAAEDTQPGSPAKSSNGDAGSDNGQGDCPGVATKSKRAAKRALKREKWLESKAARRAKQKAERKRKREELRAAGEEVRSASATRKRLKESTMRDSACRVGVVVDFSFDDYMHQRDLGKCCKQILHCYR